jgi:hypothetical protein
MMTKDKEGHPIFVVGSEYRPKSWINPVWPTGQASRCLAVEPWEYGEEDGRFFTVKDGKGFFTNGNDTRWFVATNQFEVVKE